MKLSHIIESKIKSNLVDFIVNLVNKNYIIESKFYLVFQNKRNMTRKERLIEDGKMAN